MNSIRPLTTHIPVMTQSVLKHLNSLECSKIIVWDATFGGGGHSQAILNKFPCCTLLATDRDPNVQLNASHLMKSFPNQFQFENLQFSRIRDGFTSHKSINAFIFDLGTSTDQLFEHDRGFSFHRRAKLDMRMDQRSGKSAYDVLNWASREKLESIFRDFGDEYRAKEISFAIVNQRKHQPITYTTDLAKIIAKVANRPTKTHPATKVFQALRVYINNELYEIQEGITQALPRLQYGGLIILISFQPDEEKVIHEVSTKAIKDGTFELVGREEPSSEEIDSNIRARSARMTILKKTCSSVY